MKAILVALLCVAATAAQAAIEVFPGLAQTAIVGVPYEPVRIRVAEAAGKPGLLFRFYVQYPWILGTPLGPTGAGCTDDLGAMQCWFTTDANGEITFPAMVATRAGTHVARIQQIGGTPQVGSVALHFVALEHEQQLVALSGEGQRVAQGTAMEPMVVRAVDGAGRGLAGLEVMFTSFGETQESATVVTDAEGLARSPRFTVTRHLGRSHVNVLLRIPGHSVGVFRMMQYDVVSSTGQAHIDYQDMWWGGIAESGWGVSIAQEGRDIFPVVFAYDEAGEPTWLVVMNLWDAAGFRYHELDAPAFSPRSAPFHAYDARRFQLGFAVGTFRLTFDDPGTAALRVGLHDRGFWTKRLVRQDFSGDAPAPMTVSSGMWWGGPSQNGWGISIMQQPGGMFAVWMTYGDDGKPTWFVMPSVTWTDDRRYEGAILRASGPRWPDFDTRLLRLETVGLFRFDFDDATHATFTWSVGAHRGTQRIEKQPL